MFKPSGGISSKKVGDTEIFSYKFTTNRNEDRFVRDLKEPFLPQFMGHWYPGFLQILRQILLSTYCAMYSDT